MLKIRLRRVGKRNQPSYRVVVVEHTKKIQGSYLEALGTYSPRARSFAVKEDRVLHWLNHGAQPSERMAKLLKTVGVKHKLIALPDYDRKPKRPSKKVAATTKVTPTAASEPSEGKTETPTDVSAETAETKPEETPAEATSAAASSEPPSASDGSTPDAPAAKHKPKETKE